MKYAKIALVLLLGVFILAGRLQAVETLVNDFNGAGVGGSSWAIDGQTDSTTKHSPGSDSSFRIQWSIGAGQWSGGGIANVDVDVTSYHSMSFFIYSANPNCDIQVQLKDSTSVQATLNLQDYLLTGTSAWQCVTVPFEAFKRANSTLDLTHIIGFNWIADYDNGSDASGVIYLDDISVSAAKNAPSNSRVYSGADKGVADTADIAGDTILWFDQATSSMTSNEVNVKISTGFASAFAAVPSDQSTANGSDIYLAYQIRNDGNSADKIVFTTSSINGNQNWPTTIFWDKDKSGTFTGGDVDHWDSIGLLPDSTHYFLVKVSVPSGAVAGSSTTVRITARDNGGSGANDSWPTVADDDTLTDDFSVTASVVQMTLVKSSSTAIAKPGDTVTVTLTYGNAGNTAATNVYITEVLPFNTYLNADPGVDSADSVEYYVGSAWQGAYSAAATKIRWKDDSIAASTSGLTVNYVLKVK